MLCYSKHTFDLILLLTFLSEWVACRSGRGEGQLGKRGEEAGGIGKEMEQKERESMRVCMNNPSNIAKTPSQVAHNQQAPTS